MCDALESGGGPPHSRTLARVTMPRRVVAEATMRGSGHCAAMSPPASSGRNVGRAMERTRSAGSLRRYSAARMALARERSNARSDSLSPRQQRGERAGERGILMR